MDHIDLNNFTLVVPVRERQHNLPKSMEYFSSLNCRKIIVDSSKSRYEGEVFGGFEYWYYGPTDYYSLWSKILSSIETDFYLDCSDDDFVSLLGLKDCVSFIQDNPGYSWVDGQAGNFSPKEGKFVNNHYLEFCSSYLIRSRNNFFSDDPLVRLDHIFHEDWGSPNHAVIRRECALSCFNFVSKNSSLKPLRYFDKILLFSLAAQGNYQTLPCLLNIRYDVPGIVHTGVTLESELNFSIPFEKIFNENNMAILSDYFYSLTNNKISSSDTERIFRNLLYKKKYNLEIPQGEKMPLFEEKYSLEREKIYKLCMG
jgi:glycosyltransferase domain-containing protein